MFSVNTEQRLFCDMVQFDFTDHYNNITLKTVHILKYLLDHPLFSQNLKFILMTDDDSFINVPKLYEELFITKVIGEATIEVRTYSHLIDLHKNIL